VFEDEESGSDAADPTPAQGRSLRSSQTPLAGKTLRLVQDADWLNLDYQFSLERIRPGGTWENVSDPLTHTAHGRTTHVT